MNIPGFSAERSLQIRPGRHGVRTVVAFHGDPEDRVIPQLSMPAPGWICDVMPWLCESCSPCAHGWQYCCEPGGYRCDPYCHPTWNCYERRC